MGARDLRPRRSGGISAPSLALLVCGIAVLCVGCNIFSWTHDEGGSDDPKILLDDAEEALVRRDYSEARQYAEKGIQNDPGLRFWRLRYVASQAVLGEAGITIADYFDVFTSQTAPTKASERDDTPVVRNDLLNLTIEELRAIASACPQAIAYLRELIEGLEDGTITAADLGGARFDIDAGFAVGSLLTAFVTIIDGDQNLDNGFSQHPDISIVADENGGYDIAYTGTEPPAEFISTTLVCPLWTRPPDAVPGYASILEALEGVYDAYLVAKGADTTADIGCSSAGLGAKPALIDTDLIIGQMLDYVYDGVRTLFELYVDSSCPCDGGGQS